MMSTVDNEPKFHHVKMDSEQPRRSRRKKGWGMWIKFFLLVILVVIGFYIWSALSAGTTVFTKVFSQGESIKSTNGRINVLLLGLAGGKHDGALLTDSIIIASYNLSNHDLTLISVPRDLWLDNIKYKINAAYEVGLQKKNGSNGLQFAEDKIDDVLGIPIHYAVRIDFAGFAKAVDQINGVDVDVPKTFDDYEFPITGKEDDLCGYQDTSKDLSDDEAKSLNVPPGKTHVYITPEGKVATDSTKLDLGCRYEHLHFNKGPVHLDGETALKFVRSRKGTNGEGSDFARSRRQQLVIEGFREKALSLDTLANPIKITGLINALGESIETDIPLDKIADFYKMAKDLNETNNIVLGDLGNGKTILINPPVGDYGQWVLTPPGNDFSLIQTYIKQQLTAQDASPAATTK